jgi:hypothetical protein
VPKESAMALKKLTDKEAEQVVYDSLKSVWTFKHQPGQAAFLDETIVWKDILALPPVTKDYLRKQMLVACYFLNPEEYKPAMNRVKFNEHLDKKREKVKTYRSFLKLWVVIRVQS